MKTGEMMMKSVAGAVMAAGVMMALESAHAQSVPQYLTDAENLVINLQLSSQTAAVWPNVYGSPAFIQWNGAQSSAQTECSSFLTLLLSHSLNWDSTHFKSWMGTSSPNAAMYHDAIASQNGFSIVPNISQVQPGDVIAIVYYPEYQSPSGHVMLVQDVPQPNSSKPFISGTSQWTVSVIDSSSSYHGTTDTRYAHPGGIGNGIFRLYTDANGSIVGHTWSLLSTSTTNYVPQATTTTSGRHLVIGRLNP